MKKTRTVTRTWITKSGQVKTKTYTYAHKSTKGLTLVNKRGVVMKKNVEAFKRQIDASTEYDENYKRMLKADVDNYILTRKGKANRQLTTSGFMGHLKSNELDRLFTNLGYSSDEFAEATGFDEEDLLNIDNWQFTGNESYFTVKGKKYKFIWTYTGKMFEEVNE